MEGICGIGFDLDHTLAIDNRLERVALLRLLESLLRDGGRAIGTLADEIDDIDDLLARQRRGEFSIDEAVRRFVAQRRVEPTQRYVERFRQSAVEMVEEFVIALPGVRPTLAGLRERGIVMGILSNGWNPLQVRKAIHVGFDGAILVSSEIGEQKPSPNAFDLLLQQLGADAQCAWYVGDDPYSDVAGAHEVGMRAVWMNWERKQYPSDLPPPDRTIGRFEELLELFPAPAKVR
jgi:HAD superfamily hydrolase (TIGR01549 family)